MSNPSCIIIQELREERILLATLNRPESANGVNRDLAQALLALAEQVEQAKHIDAVVITGSGRIFCAGGDVATFAEAFQQSANALPDLLEELAVTVHDALHKLVSAGPLIVGAINGPATGAGMALACACDLAYARPGATLRAGFSRLGLSPDTGSTWLLPRLMGYRHSLEFLLSGNPMSAERAVQIGLFNELMDLDQEAFVQEVLTRTRALIASGDAVRATRALLRSSAEVPMAIQLDREKDQLSALARTSSVQNKLRGLLNR